MSEFWLEVEDADAWVRCTLEGDRDAATVTLKRRDNGATVSLPQAEFAKLGLATYVPAVDDLTQMADVSDATMLEQLKARYARDDIYTAIGPVTLSINPYKKVAGCTSEAIAQMCKQGEQAPPHVVRTATIAFNGLVDVAATDRRPQSILISGESGAGKTEACKLCLLALAELSKSSGGATEAALESAILLEAFGNAKTVYNDNSSRFGKWCAVYFHPTNFKIQACQSLTYLLEKTRITNPPKGERNYHIFHQIIVGGSAQEKSKYKVLSAFPDYVYMKDALPTVDNVDDAHEWTETNEKLEILGIRDKEKDSLMMLISAVLALGNLQFTEKTGEKEETQMVSDRAVLERAASLLEVSPEMLNDKMTLRTLDAGGEKYIVPLKLNQCTDARDALAQSIYLAVFDWIVKQLNDAQKGDLGSGKDESETFVGLLDIFGFENFQKNSFEQLCINFTNEKLQAHFMDSLVKLRIIEYKQEGVSCDHIDFPDNAAQLNLIDHKSQGIYAYLDDECNVPRGSDQGFVDKMMKTFVKQHECFDKLKKAKGGQVGEKTQKHFPSHGRDLDQLSFVVCHYAEPVMYTADNWLDKNRGYLHPEVAFMLTQSDSSLVRELYPANAVADTKRASVGMAFRKSLRALSATMLTTDQNYVRCIKPNGQRKPDAFNGQFVLRQLRYTGVAAVVTIQRSGYPISMSHGDFVARYRCIALMETNLLHGTPQEACNKLLLAGPRLGGLDKSVNWLESKEAQVGKTRIYMRDEVVRALEKPRLEATRRAAISIQSYVRGKVFRTVVHIFALHTKHVRVIREHLDARAPDKAMDEYEELTSVWDTYGEGVPVDIKLNGWMALLPPLKAEVIELQKEIEEMESGLEAEADALNEINVALAAALTEGPKEAYVKLKMALASGFTVSRGYRPELTEAIAKAEEALVTCLTSTGLSETAARAALAKLKEAGANEHPSANGGEADLEAALEAKAAQDAADAARRAEEEAKAAGDREAALLAAEKAREAEELAAWEAEVARQAAEREKNHRQMLADTEEELIRNATSSDPLVVILTLTLTNDFDVSVSTETGERLKGYTEKSTGCSFSDKNTIAKVGRGSLAWQAGFMVGDTILAVNSKPLKGERVAHALNATKLESYEVRVARSTTERGGVVASGEKSGWLQVVSARDGSALALQWPKKKWVVLDAKAQILFFDSKRDAKPQTIESLKGAICKTPIMKLRGKELEQPPVIKNYIAQLKFPFTLVWEDGRVAYDLVFAASSSEERAAWTKILNKTVKVLAEAAPTTGWLTKEGGRAKDGFSKLFATNKKRWFVLTQPDEGFDATFRYYENPPHPSEAPRGTVIINGEATLAVNNETKLPHAFSITSKATADPKPLITTLSAETDADMNRWIKAIRKAIADSGGKVESLQKLRDEARRMQKQSSRFGAMQQLSELDREELLELPLKEIHRVCKHLDIVFDKQKDKNKKKLVDLIISQRETHKLEKGTADQAVLHLQTWHSKGLMSSDI